MEQENAFSEIAHPASVSRLFNHHRMDPELPSGYKWAEQKKLYCPRNLLDPRLPGPITPTHNFGYVFCHRGLYERASGIVDNSVAAIDNGIRHGLFLHEVDAFVLEQLDKAFVAHDKNPSRVTSKVQPWEFYPIHEILKTSLVTRRVEREAKNPDLTSKQSDFATSYLETDGKIPSLFDIMWRESQKPSGITLQIDLREQDFAKAIAYYSYHISKVSLLYKDRQGVHRSKGWELFRSTILKGYNKHYKSFNDLHEDVKKKSVEAYGSNYFEIRHLHVFPPLIMVFFAKYLVKLARATPPVDDPQGDRNSYEHIRHTFMNQVLSFVGVGVNSYNFILEIVHSGLGLGYDIINKTARNPLNGELLTDEGVIFDSRVDRAMIDVSVELRKRYPKLLFSSCTRLPDVITPKGEYKAWHETSRLVRWDDGEKGLAAKLRAIHGGLYPQCQLVVADDPAAEIAARTWIDQKSGLDRSQLMHMTYTEWLARAPEDVVAAITKLNNQDFMPNKFGYPTTPGASGKKRDRTIELNTKIRSWLEALLSPKPISNLDDWNQYSVDEHWHSAEDKSQQATAYNSQLSIISDDDRHHEGVTLTWENRPRNHFSSSTSSDPIILHIWGKEYMFENVVDVKRSLASMAAYKAAEEGNEQMVRNLLAIGANIDAFTGFYGTPLAAACRRGHGTVVKLLLDADADVNMRRFSGTPLELAAAAGHRDVVEMLLTVLKRKQAHCDISEKLYTGTALHEASAAGHEAVVALLLDSGADINFRERHTALERACHNHCKINVINLLLARGADVNAPGRNFGVRSALESACHCGDLYVTTLLLRKGAVIDFPLDETFTPEIVSLLVKHKADVNNVTRKPLSESGLKALRDTGRVLRDPLKENFKETSLRVRKQRKPAPSGPVKELPVPRELRDCGCLLCFIDQNIQPTIERQLIDSALWRTKKRREPPATIDDPVSVTLREMGKLTLVDRPEEMYLTYNFEYPPME
ncbi:hypothetical protein MYCTH_2308116 [Thermothelomyces thermophilus ATCC 42464]|uniref:Uncharacterized protein n=1 Tax=Thermothelomyces thermophilus (strain ATCC 42464 / BCRC 31852 / DSM 1799) TaxID=573729 RepID=G2QJ77_THET4|nr:uncharacterized protein MYCTH_2308116 [Thermothelomyces thermophilus ATCC 42464]AEO59652.1 hypothetical protein MYCTH_2308116 [Thermothelomyces thermophilus ATCC 42464]